MSIQIQRPFTPRAAKRPGAAPALWLPRNAQSIIEARELGEIVDRDSFVVSLVGSTSIQAPHVFVDPGRRYDWRFARGLHANIVTRPGIDARAVMEDLRDLAGPGMAPYLIDFDSRLVATVVCNRPLTVWPERPGSPVWVTLFR